MISRFIGAIYNLYPESSIEDIVDALWLASQIGPSDPTVEASLTGDSDAKSQTQIEDTSKDLDSIVSKSSKPQSGLTLSKDRDKAYLHSARTGSAIPVGLPFRVPAASALPGSLNIGRALRPFKRQIPSHTTYIIDEIATAKQIAEEGLWIPVLNPAPTRWFEIALIVDASSSMVIWRQTIAELQHLLERQGAFRDVRTWMLVVDPRDAGSIWISAGTDNATATRQFRSPRELVDPHGQRLFLVVTDCVSPIWRGNAIKKVLNAWGHDNPVAIAQVLQQRLWRRTALGKATPVRVKVPFPGAPNKVLNVISQKYLLDRLPSNGMCLPIVTLEPESLSVWARGLMGTEGTKIAGFVFDMEVADQEQMVEVQQGENDVQPVLSAKQRVERFRATASPMARKLAVLVAAAPVSLPIIRLIQQTMLPEARQVHIAEFFLSGLLEEIFPDEEYSNPDYVQYDFVEGVRELLLPSLPTNESMDVLGKVSDYIETHLGQSLNFHALLFDPQYETELTIDERSLPFATVATKVLWKLGGKYAALAARLDRTLSEYQRPSQRQQTRIASEPEELPPPLKPQGIKTQVIATQSFMKTFERLSSSAQQNVMRNIDRLIINPVYPSSKIRRLSQAENVFVCRINTTLRLFYLVENKKIYLLDIGDQSTVSRLPTLLIRLKQGKLGEASLTGPDYAEERQVDVPDVSPSVAKQQSVGVRNGQNGLEREEEPFGLTSTTWTGSTSPKSVGDLQSMHVDDVISYLKVWKPSGDLMGPSREELGRVLASVVESNPSQFSASAKHFQELDPQYVSALFTGLERAAKEKRSFIWHPVLDLCYWVLGQRQAVSEERLIRDIGDPVWSWSRRTIAYLLSTSLGPDTVEISFGLRTKVWEVLQILTQDLEPTIEEEIRYGGSNMDPAILAINTTRGIAMQAVIRYALWVRRHLENEHGEERVVRGFDEMPEVQNALEWHLDSGNDPSLAVRSVYGQFFPWLLQLDPRWISKNLAKIFPEEENLTDMRRAAWESYITFCNPYDNVFDILHSEYLRSIEFIRASSNERQYLEKPEGRLAEHLMSFYWRGKLDLDDPERFLSRFFIKAPDQLRAHGLEFVGHSLRNSEEPIPTQVLERLKALWEWRVESGSSAGQRASHINEFSAFGWWFISKRFDEPWAIAQLERTLKQNGSIEALHLVVEYLAELSDRMPLPVLECLELLVQDGSETWWITSLREHVHRILTNSLNNQDLKGQQGAKNLIDRITANGYSEFLNLIPERQPIADKIKKANESVPEKSSSNTFLPAILIGGPPHAGKSVLVYQLTAALRERGILHHVIRATTDGEGNWAQEIDSETVSQIRIKGVWSDEFVERIRLDLERSYLPLLVDIGGHPTESQTRIFRQCTHAVLLLRADREEDNQRWLRLIQEYGLLPLARIYSRPNGTSTLVTESPVIEGTITGLIRGQNVTTDPVFDALVERIAVLFGSYSTEELEKLIHDSAPTALVIDLPASLRNIAPSNQLWEPEMLKSFLSSLPINAPLSVHGVGPNWLYAALAAYTHPHTFYQFDPRLPFGWIRPPRVHIDTVRSPEILVRNRAYQGINVLSIVFPSQPLEFLQEKSLPFPSVNTDTGLIIDGKIPFWLLTALVMLYKEAGVPWIATYNVPYNKSVVVYSRVEEYGLGDLISMPVI